MHFPVMNPAEYRNLQVSSADGATLRRTAVAAMASHLPPTPKLLPDHVKVRVTSTPSDAFVYRVAMETARVAAILGGICAHARHAANSMGTSSSSSLMSHPEAVIKRTTSATIRRDKALSPLKRNTAAGGLGWNTGRPAFIPI